MKNQKGFVEMPVTTLNCLKSMLFSKEGGVDLTNIINDLGGDDLSAINVALIHKGVKPQIDESPRFEHSWRKSFFRYELVRYSLLLDKVEYNQTRCELDADGNMVERDKVTSSAMPYAKWVAMTTDFEDIRPKLVD